MNNLQSKNYSPNLTHSCWDLFFYELQNNNDRKYKFQPRWPSCACLIFTSCLQALTLPSSLLQQSSPPSPYLKAAKLRKIWGTWGHDQPQLWLTRNSCQTLMQIFCFRAWGDTKQMTCTRLGVLLGASHPITNAIKQPALPERSYIALRINYSWATA